MKKGEGDVSISLVDYVINSSTKRDEMDTREVQVWKLCGIRVEKVSKRIGEEMEMASIENQNVITLTSHQFKMGYNIKKVGKRGVTGCLRAFLLMYLTMWFPSSNGWN